MMLLEKMEGRHRLVLVPLRIPWVKFRMTNAFSMFKILFPIFSFVATFLLWLLASFLLLLMLANFSQLASTSLIWEGLTANICAVVTSLSILFCISLTDWYCWKSICFFIYLVLIVIPTGSVKLLDDGPVHIYLIMVSNEDTIVGEVFASSFI